MHTSHLQQETLPLTPHPQIRTHTPSYHTSAHHAHSLILHIHTSTHPHIRTQVGAAASAAGGGEGSQLAPLLGVDPKALRGDEEVRVCVCVCVYVRACARVHARAHTCLCVWGGEGGVALSLSWVLALRSWVPFLGPFPGSWPHTNYRNYYTFQLDLD